MKKLLLKNTITLELCLVKKDKRGRVVTTFCCNRGVAFKRFDAKKAEKFMSAVQHTAQTIGELLGFSVYE